MIGLSANISERFHLPVVSSFLHVILGDFGGCLPMMRDPIIVIDIDRSLSELSR
jgi:hypothetical protein